MDKIFEASYHALEDTNWWFEARRHILIDLLSKKERNINILDVGCSSGIFLEALKNNGFNHLFGVDVSREAVALCQKRGLKNTFVVHEEFTDFEDHSFDVIVASDVLEHIENDVQALKEWKRLLKPQGQLIVFVPAYPFLWSGHDVVNHHFRRYTLKELTTKIQNQKYVVLKKSYWNAFLFLPICAVRILKNILSSVDEESQLTETNPVINKMLFSLLKLETYLLRRFSFPFGVSCFVIAENNG